MSHAAVIERHQAAYAAVVLCALKEIDALHEALIRIVQEHDGQAEIPAAAALCIADIVNGRIPTMREATYGKALQAIEERALRTDDEFAFEAFAHALQGLREVPTESR